MHTRRLVAFLLGVWLGGMLLVAYITNSNISTTRNMLENPAEGPRRMIELSGRERVLTLLNHNTSEINRSIVEFWEWVQIAVGVGIVCTLPFAMRLKWAYLIAAVLMFLTVIAQRIFLTPEMIGVGRIIDMAGGTVWTQDELWKERQSLHMLQQLYWAGEVGKVMIGIGLTAALLIFRKKDSYKSRSSTRSGKVDAVDDPNYSHVDR